MLIGDPALIRVNTVYNIFKYIYIDIDIHMYINIYKSWFTPCKAEQPLRGMALQEKEAQKIKAYRKSV